MGAHSMENTQLLRIGLVGQGRIRYSVQACLRSEYEMMPLALDASSTELISCAIVVYCSDVWTPASIQVINQRCVEAQIPLIPVYTCFDKGIVGPCVLPARDGCLYCAEVRTVAALRREEDSELSIQYLFGKRDMAIQQPWLTSLSQQMLALLLAGEIKTCLSSISSARRDDPSLLSLSLETLDCGRHYFLPLPDCPYCSQQVEDSEALATPVLQSRPKPGPFNYRTRQLLNKTEQLFRDYVDEQTGMIHSVTMNNGGWFPCVISKINIRHGNKVSTVTGMGCTLKVEQNKGISIVEALERYAGLYPRGKRTVVSGSYRQLCDQALDPTTLGLHTPEQYDLMNPPFVPYHPDLVCDWVWGYSFRQQRPILVPECCVYYGHFQPEGRQKPCFVYEISNGCAIGNCLEEALLHGMLEIVERDAFVLTWYGRLSLQRLDPYSVSDPDTRLLMKHIEYHSGYTLYVFNATLDHATPTLWVLAVDEQNRGDMPKARCGGGTSPHPEHALYRALHEMAAGLSSTPSSLYLHERERALAMLADSDAVTSMADHVTLYLLPEAFERLSFLQREQPPQTFQQAFPDFYRQPPDRLDLLDDLNTLLNHYLELGSDIIVVDQTAPEHAALDLYCVKVLMPGMLPMTFGQQNRRVSGFTRLHQLPCSLGYQDHPLTEAELNPYPHPFP